MSRTFATHRGVRIGGLFLLYAAQGIPEGLLYVAVPAWLAVQGVSPAAIGAYIAIIFLPWSFKLVNGLLMDRITFLPMGRRRPWLIGAQLAMVATLLAFGAQAPDGTDLGWMMATGFLVNLAAAFQDVAIDGMAIDVLPEGEQARANGVMWGGKILGTAAASFVTGAVIAAFGFAEAALVTAMAVGLIAIVPVLVRERPGERLLPWTHGKASAEALDRQLFRWAPILSGLFAAMIRPESLLLALGIFVAFIGYGLDTAYGPVVAVAELGFTEARYGNLAGAANLTGGLFGIFLCGWLADRIGPRRALVAALIGMACTQGAMGLQPESWSLSGVFEAYTVIYILFFVLMSVSLYSLAMAISTPAVAATQFSIFMALLNLGSSSGAGRLGPIEAQFGYEGAFLAAAGVSLLAALIFALSGKASRRTGLAA